MMSGCNSCILLFSRHTFTLFVLKLSCGMMVQDRNSFIVGTEDRGQAPDRTTMTEYYIYYMCGSCKRYGMFTPAEEDSATFGLGFIHAQCPHSFLSALSRCLSSSASPQVSVGMFACDDSIKHCANWFPWCHAGQCCRCWHSLPRWVCP